MLDFIIVFQKYPDSTPSVPAAFHHRVVERGRGHFPVSWTRCG